jgi:hypothetical protein
VVSLSTCDAPDKATGRRSLREVQEEILWDLFIWELFTSCPQTDIPTVSRAHGQ